MTDTGVAGPLSGLRVADFTRVLAGPYASMMLGDMGADVVKVERHGTGDDTRGWGPHWADDVSSYFQSVNRNKTSMVCDFHDPEDLKAVTDLCSRADIVLENFRSGTMSRFGLGPEELMRARPDLVYCSLTGFGSGRGSSLGGYDSIVQALSGMMSLTGEPTRDPMKAGFAAVDIIAGLHIATGVLAAIRHRDETGVGQHVEVNLMSSALSALTYHATTVANGGPVPSRVGNRHPSIAPSDVFEAVGGSLMIAVGNDKQFAALCAVLNRDDLAEDPRFADNTKRLANADRLATTLAEEFRHRPAAGAVDLLTEVGVPCAVVNDLREAIRYAEHLGLEPTVSISRKDGTVSHQVRHPIIFARTPATYRTAPTRWCDVETIQNWKETSSTWLS